MHTVKVSIPVGRQSVAVNLCKRIPIQTLYHVQPRRIPDIDLAFERQRATDNLSRPLPRIWPYRLARLTQSRTQRKKFQQISTQYDQLSFSKVLSRTSSLPPSKYVMSFQPWILCQRTAEVAAFFVQPPVGIVSTRIIVSGRI